MFFTKWKCLLFLLCCCCNCLPKNGGKTLETPHGRMQHRLSVWITQRFVFMSELLGSVRTNNGGELANWKCSYSVWKGLLIEKRESLFWTVSSHVGKGKGISAGERVMARSNALHWVNACPLTPVLHLVLSLSFSPFSPPPFAGFFYGSYSML